MSNPLHKLVINRRFYVRMVLCKPKTTAENETVLAFVGFGAKHRSAGVPAVVLGKSQSRAKSHIWCRCLNYELPVLKIGLFPTSGNNTLTAALGCP